MREALLCQNLPPPPDDLNVVPPPPDGKNTQRERLAQHSTDPSCAACHALMDPLGLAFEIYDGIGRYRTTDVGKPIDASGTLTGAEPEGAAFRDAIELMKLLAGSPDGEPLLREPPPSATPTAASPAPARRLHPRSADRALRGERRRHDRPGGGHHHRRELHPAPGQPALIGRSAMP